MREEHSLGSPPTSSVSSLLFGLAQQTTTNGGRTHTKQQSWPKSCHGSWSDLRRGKFGTSPWRQRGTRAVCFPEKKNSNTQQQRRSSRRHFRNFPQELHYHRSSDSTRHVALLNSKGASGSTNVDTFSIVYYSGEAEGPLSPNGNSVRLFEPSETPPDIAPVKLKKTAVNHCLILLASTVARLQGKPPNETTAVASPAFSQPGPAPFVGWPETRWLPAYQQTQASRARNFACKFSCPRLPPPPPRARKQAIEKRIYMASFCITADRKLKMRRREVAGDQRAAGEEAHRSLVPDRPLRGTCPVSPSPLRSGGQIESVRSNSVGYLDECQRTYLSPPFFLPALSRQLGPDQIGRGQAGLHARQSKGIPRRKSHSTRSRAAPLLDSTARGRIKQMPALQQPRTFYMDLTDIAGQRVHQTRAKTVLFQPHTTMQHLSTNRWTDCSSR